MSTIPVGFCQCGCGTKTALEPQTNNKLGLRKGHPKRFITGHNSSVRKTVGEGPNPSGLCKCGCGKPTPLARASVAKTGWIIGKPINYLPRHHNHLGKKSVQYRVVDRRFSSPCWEWLLFTNKKGYGTLRADGQTRLAHRVYYINAKGPIPPGHEVDHLCFNPACVNPDHLEVVTPAENKRRQRGNKRNRVPA